MKKITLFIALFLFSSNSFASPKASTTEVIKFVDKLGNDIINIANEKKSSEKDKKQKIIDVIDKAIDSKWISRFVLGKNYRRAKPEQRERFSELYKEFMINTYGPKFKNYDGRRFEVIKVTKQKRFLLAKAEFLPKTSNVPIEVDFRVRKRKGKLVVLDFIAEGISLIETQRSEFNSAIAKNGMDKFLKDLAKRVEKLKSSK